MIWYMDSWTISWDIQHVAWKLPHSWALDATELMPSVFDGLGQRKSFATDWWLDLGQTVVLHIEARGFCLNKKEGCSKETVRLPLKSTSFPVPFWYDTPQNKCRYSVCLFTPTVSLEHGIWCSQKLIWAEVFFSVPCLEAFALQVQKLQQSWDDAESRVQQLPEFPVCCEKTYRSTAEHLKVKSASYLWRHCGPVAPGKGGARESGSKTKCFLNGNRKPSIVRFGNDAVQPVLVSTWSLNLCERAAIGLLRAASSRSNSRRVKRNAGRPEMNWFSVCLQEFWIDLYILYKWQRHILDIPMDKEHAFSLQPSACPWGFW